MSSLIQSLLPILFSLLFPLTIFALGYLFIVRPLKLKNIFIKVLILAVFLLASCKNMVSVYIGGNLYSPELPAWITLSLSTLQVSYLFFIAFSILKAVILFVGRKLFSKNKHLNWNLSTERLYIALILVISTFIGLLAFYNANSDPMVHNYSFTSKNYPKYSNTNNGDFFRIVHLSDTHIATTIPLDKVERLVEKVNSLHPDVVLISGDIIDGRYDLISDQVKCLRKLTPKFGVWGVNGNHEYYADVLDWQQKFQDAGIKILNNDSVTLNNNEGIPLITIAGITDKRVKNLKDRNQALSTLMDPNIELALKNRQEGIPVVLMSHRPEEFDVAASYNVDLTLSGHTHGGMIPGLRLLVAALNHGYVSGLYENENSKLIVSNGTFLWAGFYARINTPAEINVIDLFHEDSIE